ncbi:MAG: RNA polymerase sigma factor RpoE [Chloroflexota bacterium]
MDENALIEQARRGDVGAYAVLVTRYQDLAYRTAHLVMGGAAEAEDAAQEAFVKAYYALGRFRDGAPFRPWLLRIVVNEAHNRRKARDRQAALAQRASGEPPERAAGGGSPEATLLTAERSASLVAAMTRLREDDRLILAYRYMHDLSEVEIAAVLACPRGTVKSRLSRALTRLRMVLASGEGDDLRAVGSQQGGAHG